METIAIVVAALSALVSSVAALIKYQDQRRAKRQQRALTGGQAPLLLEGKKQQVEVRGDQIKVTGDVIEVTIETPKERKKLILPSDKAADVERFVDQLEHGSSQ